jgi:fermentation-respiration switch protein FrsA (DUF1100 family)
MPSNLKKSFISGLTTVATFLIVLNIFFYFSQPGMIFFPFKNIDSTPRDWGLSYEPIRLKLKDDTTISAWYIPHPQASNTVLFFHGNGGNMSHRASSISVFQQLKLNVLIIDYPGYGESDGSPTEQGIYQSADAAWQYLVSDKKLNSKNIIIFGRSLGGAVAVDLASRVSPGAVILESTFSSVRDMAASIFPLISNFIYLRYSFDSMNKIKNVSSPLLFIHSPDDEIIPFDLGKKLFTHANPNKQLLQISGGHNDGFIKSMPTYQKTLRHFIHKH